MLSLTSIKISSAVPFLKYGAVFIEILIMPSSTFLIQAFRNFFRAEELSHPPSTADES